MRLAYELERLRFEKGLSYRKLADMCNLNQHTMRNALKRDAYKYIMAHIDALAAALGADANELRRKYPAPPKDEPTCFGTHRYERILEAARGGESDAQIMADWPGLTGDVLGVYRKIAAGTLCSLARNGGMYGRRGTAVEEYSGIAFRTGSLHYMSDDNSADYDGMGRW
nr:MAG TPA: Regulatory protein [Caudoviricetes sp.]